MPMAVSQGAQRDSKPQNASHFSYITFVDVTWPRPDSRDGEIDSNIKCFIPQLPLRNIHSIIYPPPLRGQKRHLRYMHHAGYHCPFPFVSSEQNLALGWGAVGSPDCLSSEAGCEHSYRQLTEVTRQKNRRIGEKVCTFLTQDPVSCPHPNSPLPVSSFPQ